MHALAGSYRDARDGPNPRSLRLPLSKALERERGGMRARPRRGVSFAVGTAAICVAAAGAAAHPAKPATHACRVPRLSGLTLDVARLRAARAGCKLRVKGAALEEASVQTLERQSPAVARRASSVLVWLNPLCDGSAEHGPQIKEPVVTVGATHLLSGFYLDGGPEIRFSAPRCRRPEADPGAGAVEVRNVSGALVATRTSSRGHFVQIALPAGSYTITGTFLDATIHGAHPKHTESVVIPAGHTVRQDFVLCIP
jgi:hypothetical protein